jgi:hypothetical protein
VAFLYLPRGPQRPRPFPPLSSHGFCVDLILSSATHLSPRILSSPCITCFNQMMCLF